jgi:hypothetical protein
MPRLLQDLQPGTPVRTANGVQTGEVRGVYASGDTRAPQYLLVFWQERNEEALLSTDEVITITEDGVMLRSNANAYTDLPAFDPSVNPMLHRL